ncbi:MAG TPA: GH32 C-terminal domain-containing protein [Candidatus Hydrogenedentes bacterium]|nr:GH32 C-terminal domain-containing protein [Candidatus Hydrogenedentota bacterium]
MKAEKRYLNLPVKDGAAMRRVRVLVGDAVVREFDIELAEAAPDFWVFLDLAPFQGREITVRLDGAEGEAKALDAITQGDVIRGAEDLYREALRPQFHFTSRRGWNNDPNGLVFHKGEYHLYYQHNPYGRKWGNMHWGHAVSPDLVHWTELPIALYPARHGDWVFSGSAVVDEADTAGFKSGDEDVIVAAYTSTGRGECIAYSRDRGRSFTDYEGNPVVTHTGRDPKVIWHAPSRQWVMAVYDEQEGRKNGISFYTSKDLKTWAYQSRIEEYFECPELFELAVDGDSANTRWVVYAANGAYAVGMFDGREFKTEAGPHPFNHGNCFYASQTFNGIPAEDGRRIQIAWGTVEIPGMPFNQMMTFPCELTLRATDDGVRMFARPVREIEALHGALHAWSDAPVAPDHNLLESLSGDLFHIQAEFEPGESSEIAFVVRGVPVRYDCKQAQLVCGDKAAPLAPENGRIRLELLVDRVSIEIFGNDGRVYMPMGCIFNSDERGLALHAVGGKATVTHLRVYELRSAWTRGQ